MKYAVIGGGVSGLSIARILQENHEEVKVYERNSQPGGLIRCKEVDGCLFHCTGGHVFNTKRTDVNEWFWHLFNRENEFQKAVRNSSIAMNDGTMVSYPIENHVFQLGDSVVKAFINDLVEIIKSGSPEPQDFDTFLYNRFGKTLYQLYFQPYNHKVWRRDLKEIPLSWLDGKLPMPTAEEMLYNNICHVKEQLFVHSSFYYPREGGSQFIANRLADGINIEYNSSIDSIQRKDRKLIVNNEEFDKIIFTGNIKQLPCISTKILDLSTYAEAISRLEYHGTTSVFCEIENNPFSWIYLPDKEHEAHRIICTGNFSKTNNAKGRMTGTIEFTDYISVEDIKNNLKRIPYSPQYLAHHYEACTYPIQNRTTTRLITSLKERTEQAGVYLLGRFAEWEYYNMDVAMGAAIDLYKTKLALHGCG